MSPNDKPPSATQLSAHEAWEFARSSIAAFNRRDVDAILAHYAPDAELRSPLVVRLLGDPSGTVRGRGALKAYLTQAFVGAPADLRFELLDVFCGVRDVLLYYRGIDDRIIVEIMTLNEDRLAAKVIVLHQARPAS